MAAKEKEREVPEFAELVDLASSRVGGLVLGANDEFFAPKENLLLPERPVWKEGEYTDRGKWMDGWETRRRRTPGHDWCVIRLGVPSRVRGVVVDTSYFRGNFPEACSLDACELDTPVSADALAADVTLPWIEILPRVALRGDAPNALPIEHDGRCTHLRLNIHPDGGVARLRVHGEPRPGPRVLSPGRDVDLAAAEHGGLVVVCSDMFFGHRQNL